MTQSVVRVGVAVLIERDGRLLLIRRSGSHGAGTWATPGGHMDVGETPAQCGIREAYEEVGIQVSDLEFVALTNDIFADIDKHYITIWFRVLAFSGEPQIASPREMSEMGWFPWDALPQPLFGPLACLVTGDSLPPLPGLPVTPA
jgi:8-oxo-dGTP diphosphatase